MPGLLRGLFQIGHQIDALLFLLHASERHFVLRDVALGVGNIFEDRCFVPQDGGVFHGFRILKTLGGTGRTAEQSVQIWADFMLSARFHRVAGFALLEYFRAFFDVSVGERSAAGDDEQRRGAYRQNVP